MRTTRPLPRILLLLLLGVVGLLLADAGPRPARAQAPASCPNQMVAYWKLDERAGPRYDDFVGTSDATCTGGGCPQAVAGLVGGAQSFDGVADQASIPDNPSFDWGANASFSIELWMKSAPGACVGVPNDDNEVMIGRTEGRYLHWWVGCRAGSGAAIFQLRDRGRTNSTLIGPAITDRAWHHVVAVRDNAARRNYLYVDGTLRSTAVVTYTDSFTSTRLLNLGWLDYPNGPKYRYTGALDEVAIYTRALSATEIQQHRAAALAGRGYCEPAPPPSSKIHLPLLIRRR